MKLNIWKLLRASWLQCWINIGLDWLMMETHLTSWGDLRLFITGILEPPGGEQMVSSPASTLELELEVLGSGILLVCVGIFIVLIAAQYLKWQCWHFEQFFWRREIYYCEVFIRISCWCGSSREYKYVVSDWHTRLGEVTHWEGQKL